MDRRREWTLIFLGAFGPAAVAALAIGTHNFWITVALIGLWSSLVALRIAGVIKRNRCMISGKQDGANIETIRTNGRRQRERERKAG
jgi:hypothetical protein